MTRTRIVIAENSADVRGYLIQGLAPIEGAQIVWQAATAAEAIQLVESLRPAIVILDPSMGEPGSTLLRRIKGGDAPPVVIVMTNDVSELYKRRVLEDGADYFFDKSFEFDAALATIRAIVMTMRKQADGGKET